MPNIKIKDLPALEELESNEIKDIKGGTEIKMKDVSFSDFETAAAGSGEIVREQVVFTYQKISF